ncbi:peptidase S8/S53 domain-containing protein [Syncephalis plumigaleata]|nr:peptidase S8/S53 domain-containing protein [Syncephalis plumigaleata]
MVLNMIRIIHLFTALLSILSTIQTIEAYESIYNNGISIVKSYPGFTSKILKKSFSSTPFYKATGIDAFQADNVDGTGVTVALIGSLPGINYDTISRSNIRYYYIVDSASEGILSQFGKSGLSNQPRDKAAEMLGIISARHKDLTGIAPGAFVYAYNVFGKYPQTTTTAVLDAIENATLEEVNIIALPEIAVITKDEPKLRQAIQDAVDAGIIVVVAATPLNRGAEGYFNYEGLPTIAVGGASIPYKPSHWFEEEHTGERIEFTTLCNFNQYNMGRIEKIAVVEDPDRIESLPAGYIKDAMILLLSQPKNIEYILNVAKIEGAKAVILAQADYNNNIRGAKSGIIVQAGYGIDIKCKCPLFVVSKEKIEYIRRKSRKSAFIFANQYGNLYDGKEPLLADARQDSYGGSVRPDILAPSTNLMTMVPNGKVKEYGMCNGVACAVAYTVGSIALLLQHPETLLLSSHPNLNLSLIKSKLQGAAHPVMKPNSLVPESVIYQGAGLLDVHKTRTYGMTISLTNIRLELLPGQITKIRINFSGFSDVRKYTFTHVPAEYILSSNFKETSLPLNNNKAILDARTSPPIPTENFGIGGVEITFSLMANLEKNEHIAYSGYIIVNSNASKDRKLNLKNTGIIAYSGFIGFPSTN